MNIGAFSLSLTVKDINISKDFYEKLGFKVFHGEIKNKWLIMQNDNVTIGLFEGMFDHNIMTFNPGWDNNAQETSDFTDIRDLQENWRSKGIEISDDVDTDSKGPGSFTIKDPDGNQILIDQHR